MNTDWTDGEPTVLTSSCAHCGHRWYLRRERCPRCNDSAVTRSPSAPSGVVAAVTSISARLDPDGAGLSLALVDLDDGIRILARCDSALSPGQTVRWCFADGRPIASGPWVEAVSR